MRDSLLFAKPRSSNSLAKLVFFIAEIGKEKSCLYFFVLTQLGSHYTYQTGTGDLIDQGEQK